MIKYSYALGLAIIILGFASGNLLAQNTVSGTVTEEETGEILPGVNITVIFYIESKAQI